MASSMTWEEAKDRLRKLREDQRRSSEEVIDIWENYLADLSYKIGDDLWLIQEQVCIAACDLARIDIAKSCIEALQSQFPSSIRVRRLQGLVYESKDMFDKALKIYESILAEDPNNSLIRKRKVAMLKEKNLIPEAIKELNDYLSKFMSDYEAWNELCDLYLHEQDYHKAAFCLEELIMSNPHNHSYHQKYAEIRYTQGGAENMMLARKYFAQAIKLNPNNIRSLYGLFLAANNLASSKSKDAKTKKDNMKYAAWAADQISKKYKETCGSAPPGQEASLDLMLGDLQITQAT